MTDETASSIIAAILALAAAVSRKDEEVDWDNEPLKRVLKDYKTFGGKVKE